MKLIIAKTIKVLFLFIGLSALVFNLYYAGVYFIASMILVAGLMAAFAWAVKIIENNK